MFGGSKNSAGVGTSLLETPRRVLFMQILHLECVGIIAGGRLCVGATWEV
jgi:hypothetical protein